MTIDPALEAAVERLGAEVAYWSGFAPRRVAVDARVLTERTRRFAPPTVPTISRNGSCRLIAARDGWVAVNLPRPEDVEAVPALLAEDGDGCPWSRLTAGLATRPAAAIRDQGTLLGLAIGLLGEATADGVEDEVARTRGRGWRARPQVLDLTALWAGPLCGALLADAGADVIRVESLARPDPTAATQPEFYARLNGAKRHVALDLSTDQGRERLGELVGRADVVITSARARGLKALGLAPGEAGTAIHIAITAHGLEGPGAARIGFGDDCAVSGGLVDVDTGGRPSFAGDALADPLTGVRAAAVALRALARGEGGTYDVSLAATSARVARLRRGGA